MSTCTTCGAQLQPDWKFCVFCGTPAIPGAIRPTTPAKPRVNPLAILALVLACIGGPLALVFGHLAVGQIRRSGERGLGIARVATVLGYFWLLVGIGVLIYLNVPH
jgi:hypothetical protein